MRKSIFGVFDVSSFADKRSRPDRWPIAVLAALGGIALVGKIAQVAPELLDAWVPGSRLNATIQGLFCLALVPVGLGLILFAFDILWPRPVSLLDKLVRVLLWPLTVLELLGYWYIFFAATWTAWAFVFLVTHQIWKSSWRTSALPDIAQQSFHYVGYVVGCFVITFWGDRLAAWILSLYETVWDFSRLKSFLRPKYLRVYLYTLMIAAYVLANVEKFSGTAILEASWWLASKDVLLESLLTYVAVDTVLAMWKELQKRT